MLLVTRYGWLIVEGKPQDPEAKICSMTEEEADELLRLYRGMGFQEIRPGQIEILEGDPRGIQTRRGIKVYRSEEFPPISAPIPIEIRPGFAR